MFDRLGLTAYGISLARQRPSYLFSVFNDLGADAALAMPTLRQTADVLAPKIQNKVGDVLKFFRFESISLL